MGGTLPIPRQTTKLHRLQKNLSQWWQTLSRPLQSSNLTNVNERKGTPYISTIRIFGCFLLDRCGSACCATSLNQTYSRRSSTRSTALAASCPVASDSAGSPSKQMPWHQSAPDTHPSPVASSFSYIVVAYSASWSSYSSRPSFNSSSLRPRRSSGSIKSFCLTLLIGFLLLHVGNQNRIRFSTL
ncbi:hypothetical protein AAHE18_19G147400 [Arachis hypogaea]